MHWRSTAIETSSLAQTTGIWFWDSLNVNKVTGAYSTAAKMTYRSDPNDGDHLFIWSHGNDQFYIVDITEPVPGAQPLLTTNKALSIGNFTSLWPMVTTITDDRIFTIAWTAAAGVSEANLTKPYPGIIVEYLLDDILYSPKAQEITFGYQEPQSQQITGLVRTPGDALFYVERSNVHRLERTVDGTAWLQASNSPLDVKTNLRCGIRWVKR